jgi:rhodanese-related sulfurtransferase
MKALQKLGFLKLYHLDGGMMAWEKEGLQVEKGK